MTSNSGPLAGYRLIEIAGIGPTQLTGMLLADMGADIIRIERPGPVDLGISMPPQYNLLNRSRASVALDLKNEHAAELILKLCETSDALFEGFRPGVMERLGLGPDICLTRNPALVYGRMTGWGQDGPLANTAAHDPNYIAIAGALSLVGEKGGPPVYPLNIMGDFGGGGAYLALGIVAALLESSKSGSGQVVDSAIVDGVASMLTYFYGLQQAGIWKTERGTNILDGGSHFARTYRTLDNKYVVIAALEQRFYLNLMNKLNITDAEIREQQMNEKRWFEFGEKIQAIFVTKTQQEWTEIFTDSDACYAPVLTLDEAVNHEHATYRNTYVNVDGITHPAPAPRFSRTPGKIKSPPPSPGEQTASALLDWGIDERQIRSLREVNAIDVETRGHE